MAIGEYPNVNPYFEGQVPPLTFRHCTECAAKDAIIVGLWKLIREVAGTTPTVTYPPRTPGSTY